MKKAVPIRMIVMLLLIAGFISTTFAGPYPWSESGQGSLFEVFNKHLYKAAPDQGKSANHEKDWIENPYFTPDPAYYELNRPGDVFSQIYWGGETSIEKIWAYTNSFLPNKAGIELRPGVDYTVVGNVLTIKSEFIESLAPEPFTYIEFEVHFALGSVAWFDLSVVPSTSPFLYPAGLVYDLSNPRSVFTHFISFFEPTAIIGITESGTPLVADVDFKIDGMWLTLAAGFFNGKTLNPGDQVNLTVALKSGASLPLTINIVETGITNASISPESATLTDLNTEYFDITVTWNEANNVEKLNVFVVTPWEVNSFDYPLFDVSDNGDGTANLRIYFGAKSNKNFPKYTDKTQWINYVTISVFFNNGAPAKFLLKIIEERYTINVDVKPQEGGWVNGEWSYSPGETVQLEAYPYRGFVFYSWQDKQGNVISTENPWMFEMQTTDLDLVAVFKPGQTDLITVTFAPEGPGGSIIAFENGFNYIPSGAMIQKGSSVLFQAQTFFQYKVVEWKVNGQVVPDYTDQTLNLFDIQKNIAVTVKFQKFNPPVIDPETNYFSLAEPNNVEFGISWNDETQITSVQWNNHHDWSVVHLTEGLDYKVEDNTLTIMSGFLVSIAPEVKDNLGFTVVFGSGWNNFIDIRVVSSFIPALIPVEGEFDLTNPGNVLTTLVYFKPVVVVSITHGSETLVQGVDYTLNGPWILFSKDYVAGLVSAPGQSLEFLINTSTDHSLNFTISSIETNIVNATLTPESVEYVNDIPEYLDVVITWNDATMVEKLSVMVMGGDETEFIESWPYYQVTDINGLTANLRIFFADKKLNSEKNMEKAAEYTSYVNIQVHFDKGSPANIYLTLRFVFYSVNVSVVPDGTGWVNGSWEYQEGEEVTLDAWPEFGYVFVHWTDQDDNILSTDNPYTFTMSGNDLYIKAVFEQGSFKTIKVTYSTATPHGDIWASVKGNFVVSGSNVPKGSEIIFNAFPYWGYNIKGWQVNGEIVPGETNSSLKIINVEKDINVTVEFFEYFYPEVLPNSQEFVLKTPEDIHFSISWGSETEIAGLYYFDWSDNLNPRKPVPFESGYEIVGNTLIIKSDFILQLNPSPGQTFQFNAEFGTGYSAWFYIDIILSDEPELLTEEGQYDLSNPGDVFTAFIFRKPVSVTGIMFGENTLIQGVDYELRGVLIFIKPDFLAKELTQEGQQIFLSVEFSTGHSKLFTILCVETGVKSPTINPKEVTFENEFPDYFDIAITWNDAKSLDKILVTLLNESESFEWPFYLVTDNNDETANLRIFFEPQKGDKSLLADKAERYTSYVVVSLIFDIGNPVYFFMTIIEDYYDVMVTIEPEIGGWVSGTGRYSEGDVVSLNADASPGYKFLHWKNKNNAVVSSANPYEFTMPAGDIELIAVFKADLPGTRVEFVVTHNGVPVPNATVTLGGVQGLTDSNGIVIFEDVAPGSQNYSVTHEGFANVNQIVNVSGVTLGVPISLIPTNLDEFADIKLNAYPNPFKDRIRFTSNVAVRKISVAGITGQVVFERELGGNETMVVTGELPNGVYFVSFWLENGERVMRKLVRQQ